jgi:Na+-transporting NADH:ubiquinone oxidoreductase subunit B
MKRKVAGPRIKPPPGLAAAFAVQIRRFAFSAPGVTHGAPHIRDAMSIQGVWNSFVVASIPAWIVGVWSVGRQINLALAQLGASDPGAFGTQSWREWLLVQSGFGNDPFNALDCWAQGLLWFLPVFFVAIVIGAVWEALFARMRRKPVDEGLLAIAWLFALMMPATAQVHHVAIGMSFGMVFGKLVYGGSGRYLVSPALLGLVFVALSYPQLMHGVSAWVPVPDWSQPTVLALMTEEGGVQGAMAAGYRWHHVFLGDRPGSFGTTSVAAILLGMLYLLVRGTVSWRVIAGSVVSLAVFALIFNTMAGEKSLFAAPWYWHLVIGGYAFGAVFIATDPVAGAITDPGRWAYGFLVGALTVTIRLTNPSYHEGVLFAILLASMFSPLIDNVAIRSNIRRRERRLKRLHHD